MIKNYKEIPLGLYVHWPFCLVKCPYCDFNSHKLTEYNDNEWLNAYLFQLDIVDDFFLKNSLQKNKLSSIFFGGGTPSLMKPFFVENIINKASKIFGLKNNIEITLEANPSSVEFTNVSAFKKAGINRLSVGVQSLNDNHLRFLGRLHNFNDIIKTIEIAFLHFDNVSADLIYGLPNQNLPLWEKELSQFINNFDFQHISAYQLTIEKGTKFYHLYKNNKLKIISDKQSLDFYNSTKSILENNKIFQYEISNFAKDGLKCVHNLLYWKSDNWYGIGPGSMSRFWNNLNKRVEIENFKKPETWLNGILSNRKFFKNLNIVKDNVSNFDTLLMGLRLTEGIELKKIKNKNILNSKTICNFLKSEIIKIINGRLTVDKDYLIKLDYIVGKINDNY